MHGGGGGGGSGFKSAFNLGRSSTVGRFQPRCTRVLLMDDDDDDDDDDITV